MDHKKQAATIPTSRLFLYALPAVPLAALTFPLYSFIPTFYAEALGLSLASIGFVLFAVRAFDAINDPLIGWLSDRFRPAFGRRRTWFALSIPVIMIGVWKLFWPPVDATVNYVGIWTLVLSIGYTGAILSYTAWGAELETSYAGRSRVASTREALTLIGVVAAIIIPFALGWADAGEFHGFALLATIIVVTLPIFAIATLYGVVEPREYTRQRISLREGLSHMSKNAPFRRLLLAFLLNGFANSIPATLFLLYAAQRLGMGDERGLYILIYFAFGIVGVPLWNAVANRTSKHRAWCLAMLFAMLVFSPTPFLSQGDAVAFGIICVLSGLTLGADLTLPAAIQADVIDVDTARSGEQRSGAYFAIWSLATKMALALTIVTILPFLEFIGFSASDSSASSPVSIVWLGFIYGWGAIALKIPAVVLIWNFPIGRAEVDALRASIDRPS